MRNLVIAFLLLTSQAFAAGADYYWRPIATNVRQVDSHDLTGLTINSSTVITFICNGKNLVLDVGTDVTATQVAAECAAMIDAVNRDDGLLTPTTDETRNLGGEEVPEFYEVDAYNVGGIVYIESKEAGVPFTITVAENATGSITSTTVTNANGENWVSEPSNWLKGDGSRGTLPDDADEMHFDAVAPDALYGLNVFASTGREPNFNRSTDFQGNIGLPLRRSVPAINAFYFEYRGRYLTLDDPTLAIRFITGI